MPTPWQIRKRLIEVCHLAADKGYVAAYEGNFSVRSADGTILITPSRVNKGRLGFDDLTVIDPAGKPVGRGRRPSTEAGLHVAVYSQRDDVHAIAHAHPPYATAFAVAGQQLCVDCMPETYNELKTIPLVPYGTPGTPELALRLAPLLESGYAYLLQNHGVLCLGADIDTAYFRLEMVEHAATIMHHAAGLGGATSLSSSDLAKLGPHGRESGRS